jgi:hypothetical protein
MRTVINPLLWHHAFMKTRRLRRARKTNEHDSYRPFWKGFLISLPLMFGFGCIVSVAGVPSDQSPYEKYYPPATAVVIMSVAGSLIVGVQCYRKGYLK